MKKLLDIASPWIAADPQDFPAQPLFASASVAALVIDQASGRVAEANPAALRLLGSPQAGAPGEDWLQAFDPASASRLADACRHAWHSPTPVLLQATTRAEARALSVAVSTFRAGPDAYLLVRLAMPDAAVLPAPGDTSDVIDALDAMPNVFIVTDALLHIEYGNRAFLELVQADSHEAVTGRSLAHWLALTEADLLRLREQMERREAATVLFSRMQAGAAAGRHVELTAIAVPGAPDPCWGFTLRLLASRPGADRSQRTDN